jgi:hypothetical protein
MYQAVEVSRRFFNRFSHLILAVEIEDICHQVERVLVILDIGVEAREVETIGEVLLVNFAKILVT